MTASPAHQYARWAMIAVGLLLALYVVRGCVSMVVRNMPVIGGGSYQRGTGEDIVRYANRSYQKAKWTIVEDDALEAASFLHGFAGFYYISGWDKNNLAIVGGTSDFTKNAFVAMLKKGQWNLSVDKTLNDFYASRPRYTSAGEFLVPFEDHASAFGQLTYFVRLFHPSAYTDVAFSDHASLCFTSTYQLERDCIFVVPGLKNVHELLDGKISPIPKGDKRLTIVDDRNKPIEHYTVKDIRCVHSHQNGKVIGYIPNHGFVKYEKGQWSTHLDGHHGNILDMWSLYFPEN